MVWYDIKIAVDADISIPELPTTAHSWSSHCLVQVGMIRHHYLSQKRLLCWKYIVLQSDAGSHFQTARMVSKGRETALQTACHSLFFRNNWRVFSEFCDGFFFFKWRENGTSVLCFSLFRPASSPCTNRNQVNCQVE